MAFAIPVAAQQIVDVHSHIIVPEYMEMLKRHNAELEETFPLPRWSVERHLQFMDSMGIQTSVLTMPAPQPFYGDAEESARCVRSVNERSAQVKADFPGRFLFCASLPLPDVDAAIREAIYALDTLRADGIKLATNSRGQYLGDEELDPLMEVLDERHAVIVIHPHRPTPCPEKVVETTPLAMYEYPAETTRAVVNMSARNVLPQSESRGAPLRFFPAFGPASHAFHPSGHAGGRLHGPHRLGGQSLAAVLRLGG